MSKVHDWQKEVYKNSVFLLLEKLRSKKISKLQFDLIVRKQAKLNFASEKD